MRYIDTSRGWQSTLLLDQGPASTALVAIDAQGGAMLFLPQINGVITYYSPRGATWSPTGGQRDLRERIGPDRPLWR